MLMQIVVCDPKTGRAYSKKTEEAGAFLNRKIGDTVKLDTLGMDGYAAQITGGSDKTGTPMRFDLSGTARKRVLLAGAPCFHPERKGQRKRTSVRGNVVADDIHQLNVKVTQYGPKALGELFPREEAEKKADEKVSIKEQMVKESLENVEKGVAIDPKSVKGKVRR
jgi:small subunit ribosomal protein S6e